MRNFNNDRGGFKNFSDRGGFGGPSRPRSFGGNRGGFGGKRNSDRQMFDAVCDKCGQDCQVPFQPTGEKPVYCSNCFEKTNGREGGNRDFAGNNRRYESRDTKDYQQDNTRSEIEALNKKLDRILDLLLAKDIKAPAVKHPQIKNKKVKKNKEEKIEVPAETQE